MKRLQVQRWTNQLLSPSTCRACASAGTVNLPHNIHAPRLRLQQPSVSWRRHQSSATALATSDLSIENHAPDEQDPRDLEIRKGAPSPRPDAALRSPKLAALHARLSLSSKLPLQTLARTLIDPSADEHPRFNNSSLAFLGGSLINYHTAEWLMCRYPRLPMGVLYSAMEGYAAQKPLHDVARSWGVESAAAPGEEVDPGLLQFAMRTPHVGFTRFGYERVEAAYLEKFKWRRGMSSRIVLDDDFGNQVDSYKKDSNAQDEAEEDYDPNQTKWPTEEHRGAAIRAHGNFVRAVVGAIYAHCGRESAKAFIKAHILSRTLDLSRLFKFLTPVRELALLCHREEFEAPVARLLSETGRLSRTPVFVVGIYSGKDKLGEGASYSLDAARAKAAVNGLKAWYLYSPGQTVRVPSDMLVDGAKPWEAAHIDPGEVV